MPEYKPPPNLDGAIVVQPMDQLPGEIGTGRKDGQIFMQLPESKPVLSHSVIPKRPPVLTTWVVILTLRVYQAPDWLWGVVLTLAGFMWVFWVYQITHSKPMKPKWDPPVPPKKP